jgi:hypothetical protein
MASMTTSALYEVIDLTLDTSAKCVHSPEDIARVHKDGWRVFGRGYYNMPRVLKCTCGERIKWRTLHSAWLAIRDAETSYFGGCRYMYIGKGEAHCIRCVDVRGCTEQEGATQCSDCGCATSRKLYFPASMCSGTKTYSKCFPCRTLTHQ